MDPVPLPCLPEKRVAWTDRPGRLIIGLHQCAEIYQFRDLPGLQINGKQAVLHCFISPLLGQGKHFSIRAKLDVVVQVILTQIIDLGHLPQAVDFASFEEDTQVMISFS